MKKSIFIFTAIFALCANAKAQDMNTIDLCGTPCKTATIEHLQLEQIHSTLPVALTITAESSDTITIEYPETVEPYIKFEINREMLCISEHDEIVVNASENDSFRLEVYYIEEPTSDLARGLFSFHADAKLSTPDWEEYFVVTPHTVQMEEAEDGTFYSDFEIKADKVFEDGKEIVIYLSTFGGRDSSATGFDGKEPIYDIVIRLQPTSPVID